MTRGIPKAEDVLFTTEAPLGNVAQIGSEERLAFAQRVIILQPNSMVQHGFLKFSLMSDRAQGQIARLASGTTALGIKQSEFRKVLIPYPIDLEEQQKIQSRLESIEGYLRLQRRLVAKLERQKSGLMEDMLTGHVRVRIDDSVDEPSYV